MPVKRRGVTLLEIITALLILAFAFIPLIGVIGTSSGDSDVANSVAFAQTTARNILDTLLEDVPFYAVRPAAAPVSDIDGSNPEDSVAEITDLADPAFDRHAFLALFGNDASADNFARGEVRDERNQVYRLKLYVFPIPVSSTIDFNNEISFTYLPRPVYENQLNAEGRNIWYTYDDQFMNSEARSPYETPDDIKVVQPPVRSLGAFELGAREGPAGAGNNYCVMKKILLRISWKNRSGHERSVDIFTMKANLQ